MRRRYAVATAIALLTCAAGVGGAYAQQVDEQRPPRQSPPARTAVDTTARQLALHRAETSKTAMLRHGHATAAKRKAARHRAEIRAARRRAAAARRAGQSHGGTPCRGDQDTYEVTAADGSCTGPWVHKAPPDSGSINPATDCPQGAATSVACNNAIKGVGDGRNMQGYP